MAQSLVRHGEHQPILRLALLTPASGNRLLEPADRLVAMAGTVVGNAQRVEIPGSTGAGHGLFRPADDLIEFDDRLGGEIAASGQHIKDDGVLRRTFSLTYLADE